jgi:predicted nuclease of predicted toxin-antitoxin system
MAMGQLKFMIDVGVGKKVEQWLTAQGYDVKTVRSFDPKAEDAEILKRAESESRMVVTMDKDFGELVYRSGKGHAGVLILRLEDATGDEKVSVVKKILSEHGDKIRGRFCVFQAGRLRISK